MRKRPVHLPAIDKGNPAIIQFVTLCTAGRLPYLNHAAAHPWLHEVFGRQTRFHIGRYVIMPNHLHLFCSPATIPPESLAKWMSFMKSEIARGWPVRVPKLWQRDHWDTQLRSGEHYSSRWAYVRDNPVRAGLVDNADDWPYQGEVHQLWWND